MQMFLMAPRALRGPGHADQGSTTLHRALDLPVPLPLGACVQTFGARPSQHMFCSLLPRAEAPSGQGCQLFLPSQPDTI